MSEPDKLIREYYQSWFRFHPEAAVDVGVEGYAHLLTPCDDDDIGALTALNEMLLSALEEINQQELDEDQRLDLDILRSAALLELKELVEQDWRRRDPLRFLPVHAIYQLTLREVQDPAAAFAARLGAIPGHLRSARSHLQVEPAQIPLNWLQAAVIEAREGAAYLRQLHHHPVVSRYRLNAELDTAAHALEDYARFLETDLAKLAGGDFACGQTQFEMLLRHRHGLDISTDSLHRLGQRLFDETLAELKRLTRELQGDEDIDGLTQKIHARHTDIADLLEHYRLGMNEARAFVEEKNLLSLPARESLKVVETPLFLRHEIPFAAYLEPAHNDTRQQGLYYVTLPDNEAEMGEHNAISLRHTCVHEAWPGHHLQFVTANLTPRAGSLPRLLNPSATLYEGWALYCEQLMQEQGFLDAPESRFILLKDRLWRALRIMLDVELHTRGLSLELAAERMQLWLGFSPQQALADLEWYTRMPTIPMSYATGWALINSTRSRLQLSEANFNLRDFHDQLLSMGSVPVARVIPRVFGELLWKSVAQEVFAGLE